MERMLLVMGFLSSVIVRHATFYSVLRFNKFFLSLLSLQNAGVINENLIWVLMLL